MGTRAPSRMASRRNSFLSIGRKSFSGKSAKDVGRSASVTSGETEKSAVQRREHAGAHHLHVPTALGGRLEEQVGDDDVANGEYSSHIEWSNSVC